MATLIGFELFPSFYLSLVSLLIIFFVTRRLLSEPKSKEKSKVYVSSFWDFFPHREQHIQYTTNAVLKTPDSTFYFYFSPFHYHILTANPANVKHILKDRFDIYEKGSIVKDTHHDLLGDGIFNADGETWKFQRQISSNEFSTKSLRKFVEQVVDVEIFDRLIPILSKAAENNSVIDFQDVLQGFTLDTICKIAFGYDPGCLSPSPQKEKFAAAYDDAAEMTNLRFFQIYPIVWKTKRFFNIGSEKKLKKAMNLVNKFTKKVIMDKKQELEEKSELKSEDILSRFLSSGIKDEKFVADVIINFVLAGRDTSSTALSWFFWLISKNNGVEREILKEIKDQSVNIPVYDEVKDMVYTHASLTESLRLYPPVSIDPKVAKEDNILPCGLKVKKGETVTYHAYAMGRSKKIWGEDWAEFLPERWLKKNDVNNGWEFVARDSFEYPVFQAGPRICIGKDMAYLQMKRVASEVLRRFKVVPVLGFEPVLVSHLTIKMKNGFPVRIEGRD